MMITVKQTSSILSIGNFTASKKARFFQTLKQIRFNGQLILTDPKGQQWSFYLFRGYIIYATGGTHPVRRWKRNLGFYCPHIPSTTSALQRELCGIDEASFTTCWEYQLLCLWVEQQKITGGQAAQIIRSIITEVLFDVAQSVGGVTHQINPDNSLSTQLVLIDVEQAIAAIQQLWKVWQNAKMADYSPNKAPVIKQPDQLREYTSVQFYKALNNLLDGQQTLRDLAVKMNQDVMQLTHSLLPYIQSGVIGLISIPDQPTPVDTSVCEEMFNQATPASSLVACVDDNLWVCQTMEKLLMAAGYQFIGVNDALRSLAILIARKPDLIFLDLVMPNTNGYEICSKLRSLSFFRNTPIVILTGNDGIVDQVRAKLVGASDFLSKPIDAGTVLSVIRQHLEPGVQKLKVER